MHFFRKLAYFIPLLLVCASPSQAGSLKVSHYVLTTANENHLYIQVKTNLSEAAQALIPMLVRFHSSSVPTDSFKELTYNKETGGWFADLGNFKSEEIVSFSVSKPCNKSNFRRPYLDESCLDFDYKVNISNELKKASKEPIPFKSYKTIASSIYSFIIESFSIHRNLTSQIATAKKSKVRNLTGEHQVNEFLSQHKVYLSLTTSPQRIANLATVLGSIDLDLVEEVLVVLPHKYGRDGSEYTIPADLINFPKIIILNIEKDLGPISKLLPSIEYVKQIDPESIVITLDDDIGYPRGMVAELIRGKLQHSNAVVGVAGQNLSNWGISDFAFPRSFKKNHSLSDVLEGYAGIAYVAKDVDTELMRYFAQKDKSSECYVSDDLVISFVLAFSHIDRIQVSTRYHNILSLQVLDFGLGTDALHRGAGLDSSSTYTNPVALNAEKYQKCYQSLVRSSFDFQTMTLKSRASILFEL